ncbi:AAA family ATPase [Synechococcus sp. AH-603-M21]|nr:AAA family ATPase [Synechococcus sp. AH-603-M21]
MPHNRIGREALLNEKVSPGDLQPVIGGNEFKTAEGSDDFSGLRFDESGHFLSLVSKEFDKAYLRAIDPLKTRTPGGDAGFSEGWIQEKVEAGFNVYMVIGETRRPPAKGGGIKDADIELCRAFFVEWDDGASLKEQASRWEALGLPEPTVMVATGGKSLHVYWTLEEPLAPTRWKELQTRLITHCNGDKTCKNPSRVMRLPGCPYFNKQTGEITGRCKIYAASGLITTAAEIEACLPPVQVAPLGDLFSAVNQPSSTHTPRPIEEIRDAARHIPRRAGGQGTYERDRNALCGCSAALRDAGAANPDDEALSLLGNLWPTRQDARQVLASTTTRHAASFWAVAKENGFNLSRSQPPAVQTSSKPATNAKRKPKRNPQKHLSHSKAMVCFERCVEIQAKGERNSLRRRARLLKAAKDLGLASYLNRAEISQRVLEAKVEEQGQNFRMLTVADRQAMAKPVIRWLLPGVLPAGDLTILGGRPKVGKTRLAMALAAAVLEGQPCFDMQKPAKPAPVILCTDDQSDGDTAEMLESLNLWDHPRLTWSKHFRLCERDIDQLLMAISSNPGALVIIDSLRSISRCLQHGENDPESGVVLYDLKQAVTDAGGTLLLIHHCNKAVDLVGVEALSGHNAIAGAANTVLTMHYVDSKGQADKQAPERRLVREARSGEGFDLVISRDGPGRFKRVCDQGEWKRQQQEAKQREQLSDLQREVLTAVNDLPGQWLTRRQVCEALDIEWTDRGRDKECKRVERALRTLASEEEIQTVSSGSENTYSSHEGHFKASSASSPSHTKGFEVARSVSSSVVSVVTSPPAPASDTSDDKCRDKVSSPKPLASLGDDADDTEPGGLEVQRKKRKKRSARFPAVKAKEGVEVIPGEFVELESIPPVALPFDLEDGDGLA